jgi:hypothetical protein
LRSVSQTKIIELDLASQPIALPELRQHLERLYLEPKLQVKLLMRGDQVHLIEKCFDEIIAKYGVLSSYFEFQVDRQ